MIIIPPHPLLRRKKVEFGPPQVATLQLVSAVYSINDALVTLTFNRAINTDEIDTHAFKVYDGIYANQILDGATYGADGSNGITVWFDQMESYSSSTCLLNVTGTSGIKDMITGNEWGGVTNFAVTIG